MQPAGRKVIGGLAGDGDATGMGLAREGITVAAEKNEEFYLRSAPLRTALRAAPVVHFFFLEAAFLFAGAFARFFAGLPAFFLPLFLLLLYHNHWS